MTHSVEMNFCRRCGETLSKVTNHVYECPRGHTLFANQPACVGIFFITPENHVLLSERGIQPHKGMLDAFGGFIDATDISVEEAAARELQEELSLEPDEYEPLRYLTSYSVPYPFEGENGHVMSMLHWTRLTTTRKLSASDDVADVKSLPLHTFDLDLLSSDDIRRGILELRALFSTPEKGDVSNV